LEIRRWEIFFDGDRGENHPERSLGMGTVIYPPSRGDSVHENFIKIIFVNVYLLFYKLFLITFSHNMCIHLFIYNAWYAGVDVRISIIPLIDFKIEISSIDWNIRHAIIFSVE
jgi:hypothetical protein